VDIDRGLLSGLVLQVREGRIGRLDLLVGDRELTLRRGARWSFWRRPVAIAGWLE
jgi:hypothetical protein